MAILGIGKSNTPVILAGDNIINKTVDQQRIQDICKIVQTKVNQCKFFDLSPNCQWDTVISPLVPKNALIVLIYGGLDAGMFKDMASSSYKHYQGNRKILLVFHSPSKKIEGLKYLERAYDDNYSSVNFKGIDNPANYLTAHGFQYIQTDDVKLVSDKIFNILGIKGTSTTKKGVDNVATNKGLKPEDDFSKQVYEINQSDFLLMKSAVTRFKGKPSAVYIRHEGTVLPQYILYAKFQSLWGAYQKADPKPSTVWINKPASTKSKTPPVKDKPVDDGWRYVPSYSLFKQDSAYDCGDASLSMGLTELFPGSGDRQDLLKKFAGTTTSGTTHEGLEHAFLKVLEDMKLKGETVEYSISDLTLEQIGEINLNKDEFLVAHGNTKGWKPPWLNNYGHYVYVIGVNIKTGMFKIADPTKGVVNYSREEFEAGLKLISQKSYLLFKVDR